MNYTEYIEQKKKLEADIEDLKKAFIESNKPCDVGSFIEVTDSYYKGSEPKKGIVTGFAITWNGDIEINAFKVKLNGNVSKNKLRIWSNSVIKYLP